MLQPRPGASQVPRAARVRAHGANVLPGPGIAPWLASRGADHGAHLVAPDGTGVPPSAVPCNTLVVRVGRSRVVAVLLEAAARLDAGAVARHLGLSRDRAALVPEDALVALTECQVRRRSCCDDSYHASGPPQPHWSRVIKTCVFVPTLPGPRRPTPAACSGPWPSLRRRKPAALAPPMVSLGSGTNIAP